MNTVACQMAESVANIPSVTWRSSISTLFSGEGNSRALQLTKHQLSQQGVVSSARTY